MKLLMVILTAMLCVAQGPVVSIQVHGNDGKRILTKASPDGFNFQDAPPRLLIQTAYSVRDFQIFGGPEWIDSDRYDIQVKTPGQRNFQMMRSLVRELLKDRFKLQLHREKRELPVYTLTVVKGGLRMWKTSEGSCVPFDPGIRHPPTPGEKPPDYCGFIKRGIDAWLNKTLDGVGVAVNGTDEIPGIVMILSDNLRQIVIDKTGLAGKYDFHLEWDPSATAASDGDGPTLVRAAEEQLGLKLDPGKAPVEVLVIDHIEKPATTAN